jgi:hypothetical protein
VERLFKQTEQAFYEDKVIIEAQQKVIDLEPGRPMVPMSFDAGPTQFRRILRQLAEREAEARRTATSPSPAGGRGLG